MKRSEALLRLQNVLTRRRDALRRSLDAELALLGSNPEDPADDEIYSLVAETESRDLDALEYALVRVREARYGVCESCGDDIPLARLQVLPFATLCIECQRETEKHSNTGSVKPRRSQAAKRAESRDGAAAGRPSVLTGDDSEGVLKFQLG